jgi:SAM-dependent methyltransferase
MIYEDETLEFWKNKSPDLLAETAAALHRERRSAAESVGSTEVYTTRRTIAHMVVNGNGVEVGAGDRPWPLPTTATCYYGDIRNERNLRDYFKNDNVKPGTILDAQSFDGVNDEIFNFVISAHVIEHLQDPLGALRATMRIIRSGGVAIFAVPEMTRTFDRDRPPTTLDHLLIDATDGGKSSRFSAFLDHVRYVHPLLTGENISAKDEHKAAKAILDANMDIHYHAWTGESFREHLQATSNEIFTIEAHVPVQNENIFVLRKH